MIIEITESTRWHDNGTICTEPAGECVEDDATPTTPTRITRCGYCPDPPVAWIEWQTTGRPKGAPVCEKHLYESDRPNNWGDRPTVDWLI